MTEDTRLSKVIAGCRRKEENSQIALYRQFYSYSMSICLRFSPNRESALEILNDGFLKVFTKIDQYQPISPFKTWLRKILVNASIDHYRRYQQKIERLEVPTRAISPSIYNTALDTLGFEDLVKVIQRLPHSYRLVFNLYVIEGMTHKEIAMALKINIGTSKSNLAKARRKLQELLKNSHGIYLQPN